MCKIIINYHVLPNNTLHHDSHQYPTQQQPNTNPMTLIIYPTSTKQHPRPTFFPTPGSTHDPFTIHQVAPKNQPTPTQ